MKVQLAQLLPRLHAVPRDEVSRVYAPASVDIAEERRPALAAVLGRPVDGPTPLFSHLGHRECCPRRYAILWDPPPAVWRRPTNGAALLGDGHTDEALESGGVMTASLPRDLRAHLHGPPGSWLTLLDIRASHPSILGVLAKDYELLDAARGGTLARDLDPRLSACGKTIRQAFVAGGGAQAVLDILADDRARRARARARRGGEADAPGVVHMPEDAPNIDITYAEAQEEVQRFWARFPVARAYQREKIARIQRAAGSGEGVTVEHDGRTVARYTGSVRWHIDDHGRRRSTSFVVGAWTAVLRAVEAALLDLMVVAWHEAGARVCLPLYDGALLRVGERRDLVALGEAVAERTGVPVRLTGNGGPT